MSMKSRLTTHSLWNNEKGRDKIKNCPALAIYKQLFSSEICASLKRFGGSPAPLSLIGAFLNYVGNHTLYHIYDKYKKRIFYPFSEVVSIKHLPNGEMMTTVSTWKDGIFTKMQFRSRAVVLSNGGKPSIPREIFNGVPKDKLITADYLLRREGFENFISTLIKNPAKRKIVIIGGSHSGFSSAWMLLNGPACYNHNKNGWKLIFDDLPTAKLYTCKWIEDCGNHILDSYTSKPSKTPKECHCFGNFSPDSIWKYEKPANYPKFGKASITILYKDRINVFYRQVKHAIEDGYNEYKSYCFRNKSGYLYSFTGLRGDAKRLYQDITKKKEDRVKLVQADTWEQQQKYVDAADYVILAWGYQTGSWRVKF